MVINVFPAQQGFPRPPDGGVPAPTFIDVNPTSQAFAPAPLVNPFPIPPPASPIPFLPASQSAPPVPVQFEIIPPAIDVDLANQPGTPTDAPTYVVTDVGSLGTVVQESKQEYVIDQVHDYDTGGVPTTTSVNIKITLQHFGNERPLTSYGVSISGRVVTFVSGPWIPAPTSFNGPPQRTISLYDDFTIVIPNNDTDGNPFNYPFSGPDYGDKIEIDVAWQSGQIVSRNLGQVQDVIPQTNPLMPELGTVQTDLPIQEIDVTNQETVVGTPIESSPNRQNNYQTNYAGAPIDVFPSRQDGVIGIPINVFPARQNT